MKVREMMTIQVVTARPDTSLEAGGPSDGGAEDQRSPRRAVQVEDGHVRLEGSVQAKTEAASLEEPIAGVDGVWSVQSDVRFLVDDTQRHDETRPFRVPRPNW